MSIQVPVAKAKADLDTLLAQAEAGEDVLVTREGKPAVRLVVVNAQPGRKPVRFGDLAHLGIKVPDDLSLPK